MTKPQIFDIEFDGDTLSNVYLPGQLLTGRVRLILDHPLEVRSLRLVFDGRAHVEWTERTSDKDSNGNDSSRTDTYKDEQIFFEKQIILFGISPLQKPNSTPIPVIPQGEHNYAFKFPIPATNLPGNYKGFYGNISYSVKAQIARSTFSFDYKTEKSFQIKQIYDLKLDPTARHSQEAIGNKDVGCWCCASGRIVCEVRTPKMGYVEGETVEATILVQNNSLNTVRKVSVKLIQRISFKVNPGQPMERSESTVKVLTETSRSDTIPPRRSQKWENASIKIPSVSLAPPTVDRKMCRIVQMEYFIAAEVVPRGFTRKFTVEVPIIIGTVAVPAMETMDFMGTRSL